MSELKEDEVKKLFLTTGQMRMIGSKNTKIISQVLRMNFEFVTTICFSKAFNEIMFNEQ